MPRTLFTATSDGYVDFFLSDGTGYRDAPDNAFKWKVEQGEVFYCVYSRKGEEIWNKDSRAAQNAYRRWVAKLVTEEI